MVKGRGVERRGMKLELDIKALAHDIKTPLSVLKSFVEASQPTENKMVEFGQAARRSIDRIIHMLDGLGEDHDDLSAMGKAVDVASRIKTSLEAVSFVASRKGVTIRYQGPTHLAAKVQLALIDRAFGNILVNAIDASCNGGEIIVKLGTTDRTLKLEVIDSGIGIAAEKIPQIFDRGFTHGKVDGDGIGLDICREIVNRHGGTIEVASQMGRGSRFTLNIPQAAKSCSYRRRRNEISRIGDALIIETPTLIDTRTHTPQHNLIGDAPIFLSKQTQCMEDTLD